MSEKDKRYDASHDYMHIHTLNKNITHRGQLHEPQTVIEHATPEPTAEKPKRIESSGILYLGIFMDGAGENRRVPKRGHFKKDTVPLRNNKKI